MSLHAYTTKGALIVALSLVLAACGKQDQPAAPFPTGNGQSPMSATDCDKLPDPKPADDSAAGRATAVSQGAAARAACKKEVAAHQDKPSADIARMREIMEKQEAERGARKISEKEWGRRLNEGASKPIKEYKY